MSNPISAKTKKYLKILIIIAVILAILYYFRGLLAKAFATAKSAVTGTASAVASATGTTSCSKPVSLNSSPDCIYWAFNQSGYINALKSSIAAGTYPSTYLDMAKNDPKTWLQNHPYLYTAYPDWFVEG